MTSYWYRPGQQSRSRSTPAGAKSRRVPAQPCMEPTPDAVDLDQLAARNPDRLALVPGTEGAGMSAETLAAVDLAVKIPMRAGVDSLNVVAASAVAFWELRPRA